MLMCLVFFLLSHVYNRDKSITPNRKDALKDKLQELERRTSSNEASVRSLESDLLLMKSSNAELARSIRDSDVQEVPVVYAGALELPEPQPTLPFTLFGRLVQIADFSRAHIEQVLREVQDEGFYNLAFDAIATSRGKGKTVIDIGGNFGGFSIAAKIKAPEAKLLTLEALPSNCANIKANMEVNGFTTNWIFMCGALGATDGDILHFSVDREHSGGGSSVYKNPTTDPSLHDGRHMFYDVVSNKLDTILERYGVEHVHALKIDCEGCEYDTLKTSKRVKDIDVIVAEFHMNSHLRNQGHSFENLKSFLRKQNPNIKIYSTDINMHDAK